MGRAPEYSWRANAFAAPCAISSLLFSCARMKAGQLIGEKLRLFKSKVDVDLKVSLREPRATARVLSVIGRF
jgi:hypothetical protein